MRKRDSVYQRLIGLFCFVFASLACASAASTEKAVVIVGFSADVTPLEAGFLTHEYHPSIHVGRLHEEKDKLLRGESFKHKDGPETRYYSLRLKPGRYIFHQASTSDARYKFITCMEPTYSFDVNAGDVLYVGNLRYTQGRNGRGRSFQHVGFVDDTALASALGDQLGMSALPQKAELATATLPKKGTGCR